MAQPGKAESALKRVRQVASLVFIKLKCWWNKKTESNAEMEKLIVLTRHLFKQRASEFRESLVPGALLMHVFCLFDSFVKWGFEKPHLPKDHRSSVLQNVPGWNHFIERRGDFEIAD